jgi:hypothetical protein
LILPFQNWLFGRIAYIISINPKVGYGFLNEFNKIDWTIKAVNSD